MFGFIDRRIELPSTLVGVPKAGFYPSIVRGCLFNAQIRVVAPDCHRTR